MLTIKEVAHILHLHPCTIRRMVKRGELQAVKLGYNLIRIEEADLKKFVSKQGIKEGDRR